MEKTLSHVIRTAAAQGGTLELRYYLLCDTLQFDGAEVESFGVEAVQIGPDGKQRESCTLRRLTTRPGTILHLLLNLSAARVRPSQLRQAVQDRLKNRKI